MYACMYIMCASMEGVGRNGGTFEDPHFSVFSGPTAIAFISYSSLGNIINATFFEESNEKDRVYLNSEVVSAAIGPQRNKSLSKSVILSFQHVKVSQSCNLNLLRCLGGGANNVHTLPSQCLWAVLSSTLARTLT